MQQEHYVSTQRMLANGLWGAVVALISAAWIIVLFASHDDRRIGYMLAVTSLAVSAAATVAHLRCYHMKLARLVRLTSGLQEPSDERPNGGLRSVPR